MIRPSPIVLMRSKSDGKVALVDPGRDTAPYLNFAEQNNGKIVAVFETHPHADFVSSHLEFHKRYGADIYINPKGGVSYDHKPFMHNDEVKIGNITIKALFTPGHSPDHNSYLIIDESGKENAVFTGDALFVGDVGRPDLREGTGNIQVSKKELAGMMYNTLNDVFSKLEEKVVVYPAHGPGSLCGKSMSPDLQSTTGKERRGNWAFQFKNKSQFVDQYLEGQSFIPKYFPFEVELNRKGAQAMDESIKNVNYIEIDNELPLGALIVDVRAQHKFKAGHLKGAINIQNGENDKFETWLGSIIGPEEKFYLIAESKDELDSAVKRASKIGYEINIKGIALNPNGKQTKDDVLDLKLFKENPDQYTIVDIRNEPEVASGKVFQNALNIPLPALRERVNEVATGKPILVHCAGGYRSAAGSSILAKALKGVKVYDLSEAINDFK